VAGVSHTTRVGGAERARLIDAASRGDQPEQQDWREDALSEMARELGIDPARYYDGERYLYRGAKQELVIAVALANIRRTDNMTMSEDV
jgi:hypothetical protein